jgi:ribosomal protein L11 methyltransferase
MAWQRVSTVVSADVAPDLAQALEDVEALAVTMLDAADQPVYEPLPGTTPLWNATRVEALFTADFDWERATARVSAQEDFGAIVWHAEPLADQAWERAWMDRFKPMQFGARLWICPTAHPIPPDAHTVLKLDPGLAFGTGTHPTTALCLESIDGLGRPGPRVIDYGCGSGVLGVAALLLGAEHVQAVDIDPQALTATSSNAAVNDVGERLEVLTNPDALRTADLVLANILASPLLTLAPELARLTAIGGHIVLSGILREQAPQIVQRYSEWFDFEPVAEREEWAALKGLRRDAV